MQGIDLSGVKAIQGVEPGEYVVTCVESEMKDTQSGTGKYVKCKFAIEGSPLHIWHNFNIVSHSEKAQEYGLVQLKAFLTVSGYQNPDHLKDVWELINLRCKVLVKKESDDYGEKTVIKLFKPIAPVVNGKEQPQPAKSPF